jgi:3-methyladenine DNA glycosylase AlkD
MSRPATERHPQDTTHPRGTPSHAKADPPRSVVSVRASAFVAANRDKAEALGRRLADLIGDPDALATAAYSGLIGLSDPAYVEGQRLIAPGIGEVHGVRWPLLAAVARGFRQATRRDRSTPLLLVADRLLRAPTLEERWLAFGILERVLADDPERAWQLLRPAAREAADWITVDSLAHPYGRGILLEPYRWAEIEQLVYSPSRWERRLVGSTIATIPFIDRRLGRDPVVAHRALRVIGDLIGDDEPDVQKALAWALRSLTLVDRDGVLRFCMQEAAFARERSDGHRAWVVRDALSKLDPDDASRLRSTLDGLRRRPGTRSTSRASAAATAFAPAGLPQPAGQSHPAAPPAPARLPHPAGPSHPAAPPDPAAMHHAVTRPRSSRP